MNPWRLIHAARATYPIVALGRVVRVARSAYDAWARRGVPARARAAAALAAPLAAAHARSRRTCGAPRTHAEPRAQGVRRARTTVAEPAHVPAPNLVARDFRASAPNRLWRGDITGVATHEGWLYLAVPLEAHSRRVVGWAMADHLRAELAAAALAMALRARRPPPGLAHHADRGSQDTAATCRAMLADRERTVSLSRAGECLDNAVAERCFATLKAAPVGTRTWPPRAAAQTAIFEWIGVWHSRQRRHSTRGDLTPVAREERHLVVLQALIA